MPVLGKMVDARKLLLVCLAAHPRIRAAMVRGVVAGRKRLQVFRRVVGLVLVLVVDVEPWRDGAVVLLPHVPMHRDAAVLGMVGLEVAVGLAVKPDAIQLLNRVLARSHGLAAHRPIVWAGVGNVAIDWPWLPTTDWLPMKGAIDLNVQKALLAADLRAIEAARRPPPILVPLKLSVNAARYPADLTLRYDKHGALSFVKMASL